MLYLPTEAARANWQWLNGPEENNQGLDDYACITEEYVSLVGWRLWNEWDDLLDEVTPRVRVEGVE